MTSSSRRFPPRLLLALVILATLIVEFYLYMILTKDKKFKQGKWFVSQIESLLCNERATQRFDSKRIKCPNQGIVTAYRQFTLAQDMWQYANIVAASLFTGLSPLAPGCMLKGLSGIFKNLTVNPLSSLRNCDISLQNHVSTIENWQDKTQSIIFKNRLCNEFVVRYLGIICREFSFTNEMEKKALIFLNKAKGNRTNVTFIAVHISKRDYLDFSEEDVQFYVDALNHCRKNYRNPLFVVVIDRDINWKTIFKSKDIYVVRESTIGFLGIALSILSKCNHTILSTSGYAVWGALLSGGDTIINFDRFEDEYRIIVDYNLNWDYLPKRSEFFL